jgi:AcrR family transcriptional regulator
MTSRTADPNRVADAGAPEPACGPGQLVAGDDAIVRAAYELLAEAGLEGLTVRAVLTRTGVNRRVFYERFSGKDDLVLAVFEQSLASMSAECRRRIADVPDPLERLRDVVAYIVLGAEAGGADPARSLRRSAALCREHLRLAEARPEDLRRALKPLIALMAEQLAAGVASGQVRDRPPERLAAFVYNLVSTTMHAEVLAQEAGEPEQIHRAQLANDLWEFCRRAIAP